MILKRLEKEFWALGGGVQGVFGTTFYHYFESKSHNKLLCLRYWTEFNNKQEMNVIKSEHLFFAIFAKFLPLQNTIYRTYLTIFE